MNKNSLDKVCIFCGSSPGFNPIYAEMTLRLAQQFVAHHIGLVYGGSNIGLMRVMADEIMANDLPVIGVMPHFLAKKEIAYIGINELIMTENMYDRKMKMVELSDAFITMPGGLGTLDELSEILTLYQLNLTDKPLAIYNVNHYYDSIVKQLDVMVEEGFLRNEQRQNIIVESQPEELMNKLLTFRPTMVPHKWVDHLKVMTQNIIEKR
ncbi:MAG: TIGR00730 family Rossman fold protein [Bacteroidales bacterium]|nr:TIGR00730 family Rossman fold protein [Bacteroidales bacterium]